MKRIFFIHNDRGMTLIEVLGAITILSIVLIGFMSFFPQSILMSQKAEDNLTAVNVAERVLTEVKKASDPHSVAGKWDSIDENGRTYYPVVEIISEVNHDPTEIDYGLKRIQINVYTNDPEEYEYSGPPKSRLYGYIELEGE